MLQWHRCPCPLGVPFSWKRWQLIRQFVAEQHKINWKLLIPIHQVCVSISPITAKLLLTIRAISGCDCTSSSLFGHGKKNIFKTLTNIPDIVQFAEVIALSRHTWRSCWYCIKTYDMFIWWQATRQFQSISLCHWLPFIFNKYPVSPERLPPTINAAKFHIYQFIYRCCNGHLSWKLLLSRRIWAEG